MFPVFFLRTLRETKASLLLSETASNLVTRPFGLKVTETTNFVTNKFVVTKLFSGAGGGPYTEGSPLFELLRGWAARVGWLRVVF